ncbi:MAG TPA: response regulator [Fulvivirga sp.]|nr:response regulator [Fulvivirga sp.]
MTSAYVLLIDDDEVANFVNNRIIQNTIGGIKTVSFLTASEGLNYLKACNANGEKLPEYIFLDINMPEMSGWEFLGQYADLDAEIRGNIKVYMLSSSQNEEDFRKAEMNENVSGFLNKPLLGKDLLEVVDHNI